MPSIPDDELRALIQTDPAAGWRAFIDQYTPLMVGLLRRAGLTERDEAMDVYVQICENLSEYGFQRLKSQDAARGSIGGWLAVITRHAVVDWIRSRKGRRRLFQAVKDLPAREQRIFEMYYWDDLTPSEIAETLAAEQGARADLAAVLGSLERIQAVLSDRHRAELMALAARSTAPIALDESEAAARVPDPRGDPEAGLRVAQLNERFDTALRRLPAEDAAIIRLKYFEGLTLPDIQRALGTAGLSVKRLEEILGRLRDLLSEMGVGAVP